MPAITSRVPGTTPVSLSFKALPPTTGSAPNAPQASTSLGAVINFPFTPRISQTIDVAYSTWELQHTNYQPSAFGNRATPAITIDAKFASRNEAEAAQTLKALHILRSATSMFYGRADSLKGTPPPIGRFNAHGLYNNTPVVVKSFQANYPDDIDYTATAQGQGPGGMAQNVPVLMDITIQLIVQMSSTQVVNEYTLPAFASGALIQKGYV